jgi:pyruvate,water dikinase
MIPTQVLASGTKGTPTLATATVLEWQDIFLDHPELLSGAVIYDRQQTPLFKAAFIVEHGAAALLMAEGGKNYHPLILATEAGIPAIAGIGKRDDLAGRLVTVDAGSGQVYAGELELPRVSSSLPSSPVTPETPAVYVNVGYPSGLREAAASGASGIGLMRTEFAAVKTLALHLRQALDNGMTCRELLEQEDGNEADTIYALAKDNHGQHLLRKGFRETVAEAVRRFGPRQVIVRTLDIARRLDEPMGNRGIRRCVSSGGKTIELLCEAIREVLEEQDGRIGLILPLVSHYSQIRKTMEIMLKSGLNLRRAGSDAPHQIDFGWEIEQPAASQNNQLWLSAFIQEFGQAPHMIGIGTNDLTQFTIALGRDAHTEEKVTEIAQYLHDLYDERDFSVVRQVIESACQCRRVGTRVFLLGQAGADRLLAPLLFAYQVTPSVAATRVRDVQAMALESLSKGAQERALRIYKNWVLERYPAAIRATVEHDLDEFFQVNPPLES